jgi:hypothetical protein
VGRHLPGHRGAPSGAALDGERSAETLGTPPDDLVIVEQEDGDRRIAAGPIHLVALGGGSVVDLLGEVEALAHLLDQRQLGLQPVGVLLFAFEDLLEQVAAAVVAELDA